MKKVIINASAGGKDSGLKGNGITEKDITLEISKIIENKLKDAGVEVYMMREADETISYDDRIKKAISKFGNDKDVILISNTLNDEDGIDIIYPLKNKDTLAKSISDALEYFNKTKYYQYRSYTDTTKDYYLITRETPNYETIIVRYGNPLSSNDAALLKNDYKKMADAIADAILSYIGVPTKNTYVVKSGDTLYSIARKFNVSVQDLLKANNMTTNTIYLNQVLKIPTTLNEEVEYYKVKSGDTLYSIAKKYNLTVNELKKLNNLKSDNLSIGQLLKVSNQITHTVVSGDTLYALAKKYNTTVDSIKQKNNLKNNNLSIGDVLKI